MIGETAGSPIHSLSRDISTLTREEIAVFSLADSPLFRDAKKKR
jgi:hypothetical protein